MGRPKGSKNKKPRAKARSAWDTYSDWYDQYTKGKYIKNKYTNAHKAGWFRPKLTKEEFEEMYELAKRAGIKTNRARTIATSQEYVNRAFERKYKEFYGKKLGDIRKKEDREQLFFDFVADMQAQGMTYDEGREEFEKYFY